MANTTPKPNDAIKCRLHASGIWKLRTVAHFGGDETGIADMCLLRDAEGKPFIPGASIAGAARSFLARQVLPWTTYKDGLTEESPELKRLFGGGERPDAQEPGTMSALIVADATCVSEHTTFIRDGVRIDAESGTAVDKAKYDVEVVERETEFKLELECIIRKVDAPDEANLKDLFLALLYAFERGDIRLGARTRRGYGRGKVECWKIRDLRMDTKDDVLTWLRDDALACTKNSLTPHPLKSDQRSYFHMAADFELCTSLLIRSASVDPNAPTDEVPDTTHLHSNERPVVPGTSFAGAFRHRATLIANALNWCNKNDDPDLLCEMFGPVHEQENDNTQSADLWASRVQIEERLVKRVKPQWQDRVAIDRFTGGSLQSALFNEKPIYPLNIKKLQNNMIKPNIRLRLTLEEPDAAEIGLLLLTLRDFWSGHAALGGETSNGRGTLRGIKAQLKFKRSGTSNVEVWKFSHGENKCKKMTLNEGDKTFLESCIGAAQGYSNCPAGSRRPDQEKEVSDA